MGRRVLITGLDTFWGGRMAQALEAKPDVEMILGLGTKEPRVPLERTEFVRSDQKYSILSRIVRATQVDTIVHTFLETNSTAVAEPGPPRDQRDRHPQPAGRGRRGSGASVRKVVVKSSTHVYGAAEQDPTWFREEDTRTGPVRTRLERSLLEVESLVRDFADDNPHLAVTVLRFANVLGTDIVTPISHNLRRRLPAVHRRLRPAGPVRRGGRRGAGPRVRHGQPAARACSTWPARASCRGARWPRSAGAHLLPLPPVRPRLFAAPLERLGAVQFPPEMEGLVRFGRGVDTSRLREAGFEYRYTSAGAVRSFARANNLRRATGGTGEPEYRYEQDVEQFFRHSPAVVRGIDT